MTRAPENSDPPTQSITCCNLDRPLTLEIRVEYVLQDTEFYRIVYVQCVNETENNNWGEVA